MILVPYVFWAIYINGVVQPPSYNDNAACIADGLKISKMVEGIKTECKANIGWRWEEKPGEVKPGGDVK